MAFTFAKMRGSPNYVPSVELFTVGVGGVTLGDPVVGAAGPTVIVKTGGADTVPILGVAMGTVAAGGQVEVMMPNDVVWRLPIEAGDAPVLGLKYGLSAALTLDDDNVVQQMVKVVGFDEFNPTTVALVEILA